MNRKISIPLIAALFSAMCIYAMMSHDNAVNEHDSLLMQNIEALTQEEDQPSFSTLVPDHYMQARVESFAVVCDQDGKLNIGSKILSGDYKKNQSYPIIVQVKNCDGVQIGAFCDQTQVGVEILN